MDSFQEKYNALVIKYNALLAENEKLKSILSQHGIVYSSIKCADESTAYSCSNKVLNVTLQDLTHGLYCYQ